MRRTWTIIGVRDVAVSFRWYRALLGLPEAAPGHDDWGQIRDTDGTVLLSLHAWGAHEHPSLMSSDGARVGNGLLLFFRVDDFDTALPRARSLVDRFDEEPHVNENTGTEEFSLRDPDGYYVVISALGASSTGDAAMSDTIEASETHAVLRSTEAQLFVAVLDASCDFYKKLGFAVAFVTGDPPFFGQVVRERARLNLRVVGEPVFAGDVRAREHLLSASFTVATNAEIERLFQCYRSADVVFHQPLWEEPWGAKTFVVRDPDENLVLFAGPAG